MAIQGKLIGITIDSEYVRCQTDLTFNITSNTSTEDACKPDPSDPDGGMNWDNPNVDSMAWDGSFSARSFADSVDANQATIINKLLLGNPVVGVVIQYNTTSSEFDGTVNHILSGNAIISGFTLNAPGTGSSTYDVTLTGKGKPTLSTVPVTT